MIVLVTGPPGAGKSFYALRKLGDALDAGKPVATNVELAPDAALRVARSNPVRRILGRVERAERRIRQRLLVSEQLGDLFRVRLAGRGEGRGVMVLDEAHYWLNARNWSKSDRESIVTFFTQHRKLGWDVYLIVQDAEMIDKQVRSLIEYHVHLKNLRRARVFGVLPFCPVNCFLALWTWHGMPSRSVVRREVNFLSWHRRLYNTHQTHHGLTAEGEPDVIWLPRLAPPAGEHAGPTESVPARAAGRRRLRRRDQDTPAPAGGQVAAAAVPPPVAPATDTQPNSQPDAAVTRRAAEGRARSA